MKLSKVFIISEATKVLEDVWLTKDEMNLILLVTKKREQIHGDPWDDERYENFDENDLQSLSSIIHMNHSRAVNAVYYEHDIPKVVRKNKDGEYEVKIQLRPFYLKLLVHVLVQEGSQEAEALVSKIVDQEDDE